PLPPTATSAQVRQALMKLSADCAVERARHTRPVHRTFVRVAARHPFRPCFLDSTSGLRLSYARALAAAGIMARKLRPVLGDASMIGLWLPSSAGGALANLAVALLGKTAVNLNYTSANEAVQSAVRQCRLCHILSSELFLDKLKLPDFDPGV